MLGLQKKIALGTKISPASIVGIVLCSIVMVIFDVGQAFAGQSWPFKSWHHAKAYSFNMFHARGDVPATILKDGKWSPYIVSEKALSGDVALDVAKTISYTKGSVGDSKCFFPRHAIVYFDKNDDPVASVDICFECSGVVVSPDFSISNEERYGYFEEKTERFVPGTTALLEKVIPKYQEIFEKIGFETDLDGKLKELEESKENKAQ